MYMENAVLDFSFLSRRMVRQKRMRCTVAAETVSDTYFRSKKDSAAFRCQKVALKLNV